MIHFKTSALATLGAALGLVTLYGADGSRAFAQDLISAHPAVETPQSAGQIEQVQLPQPQSVDQSGDDDDDAPEPRAASLAALVAAQPNAAELSRELNCLAGAIYFEAKSESLAGQLAVGRVITARSKSGRFPSSYCGVVFQRSQFSFVRGNAFPAIAKQSKQWKNAVAIARIAHEGTWRSPAEGALFFHAAYVSPGWKLTRIARVENHVFYR